MSCAWTLAAELVDELLRGGARDEGSDDVPVTHVGQFVALLAKAPNVVPEGLASFLPTVPKVPGVARPDVGPLEVSDEDVP